MNVLKKYCFHLEHFSLSDMMKILNGTHQKYEIERRSPCLYFIKGTADKSVKNLRCISKYYTVNSDGKAMKINKGANACFNCKMAFGIRQNSCIGCHKEMIERFEKDAVFLLKK